MAGILSVHLHVLCTAMPCNAHMNVCRPRCHIVGRVRLTQVDSQANAVADIGSWSDKLGIGFGRVMTWRPATVL